MPNANYPALAGLFHPGAVADDTLAWNQLLAQAPRLPLDIGVIRVAIATQMAASTPEGTLYQSPRAEAVDVPDSSASIRLLRPEGRTTGVCVHVHGGGWSFGAANEHDRDLETLADELEVTVASVEYRLAPEHPFPAPGNDVYDAISFVTSHGSDLVGDDASSGLLPVVVVGESAGANLVLSAICRMRDDAGGLPAGMVLFYGAYDLSMTPSQVHFGSAGLVNTESLAYFYSLYAPGHDLRDPRISPLFAPLAGLPPTQLLVGTDDPLVDDTLFLHARLLAAQVDVGLHVAPGGGHGFNYFPIGVGRHGTEASREFIRSAIAN